MKFGTKYLEFSKIFFSPLVKYNTSSSGKNPSTLSRPWVVTKLTQTGIFCRKSNSELNKSFCFFGQQRLVKLSPKQFLPPKIKPKKKSFYTELQDQSSTTTDSLEPPGCTTFFAKTLHPITKVILPSVCEVIKIHEILKLIHLSDSVWECLSPGKETWRVNKEMRQWIRSSYDKDPGNSYRSIVLWDKGSITHS